MAHYDVPQIVENIERTMNDEAAAEEGRGGRGRSSRRQELQRSVFKKLENGSFKFLRQFHAVDRVPEGVRMGIFKKILARALRLVSAPQTVYNWNNLQALQTMAYEMDVLRERIQALELGPAKPLGMSRLHGAETTRLANVVQQHLQGFHDHVDHMSRNMTEIGKGLGQMLDTLGALSSRLNALSANHRDSVTEIAGARLDISRLWTEIGLVYESLDTRAEDIWRGLDERDGQMTMNTDAIQRMHGQVAGIETVSKELRARLFVLTEQLAIQQEMVENLSATVKETGGAPRIRTAPPATAQIPGHSSADPAPAAFTQGVEPGGQTAEGLSSRQLDLAYMRFQRQYRGDEDELRGRQKEYIELLAKRLQIGAGEGPPPTVLDVACGDGIFVELMKQRGWNARGVDLNEIMVKQARSRGLDVELGDAIGYIERLEAKSLDAITAFQFVEHLPPPQLMRLLKACFRALRPDGAVLIETINPHTLKALHWYHLDLSHERLIFPEMLQLLAETSGFLDAEWQALNPVAENERLKVAGSDLEKENLRKLNDALFGSQDYYLIARRPGKAVSRES